MSEKGENFLDLDTYQEECSELGEADSDAQDQLARYLHSLGIALNFRDDARLQDTHVLNPHWVTNGIYQIINAPLLAQQKGEIALNDLRSILDPKNYPARMHGFLLNLMRKFELCFPLREDAVGHFLVPGLLDKQEPIETAEFAAAHCLNFEYHYPILPEGLIPRFIVRTYPMSGGLSRWRSGVVLKFDANRALVRGDAQERKVSVSVAGPAPGRRNLLAIIRADFERIHADIAKLQPKAMVPVPDHPSVVLEYDELLKFEEDGWAEYPKKVGDKIAKLNVRELLNGVDVRERERKKPDLAEASQGTRLFISYAHKDEEIEWRQEHPGYDLYEPKSAACQLGISVSFLKDSIRERLVSPGHHGSGLDRLQYSCIAIVARARKDDKRRARLVFSGDLGRAGMPILRNPFTVKMIGNCFSHAVTKRISFAPRPGALTTFGKPEATGKSGRALR